MTSPIPGPTSAGSFGQVSRRGYCAIYDGEELAVKNSDDFNEQYDILSASQRGALRRGIVPCDLSAGLVLIVHRRREKSYSSRTIWANRGRSHETCRPYERCASSARSECACPPWYQVGVTIELVHVGRNR